MSESVERRKPVMLSRLLLLLSAALVAFYLVAGAIVSLNQRWFIYVPPTFTSMHMDRLARAANLERWTNSAGQPIGMKRLSPRQPAQGSVLVLYGNGNCTVNCANYVNDIQNVAPFDVFILEYPGYEDRPGSPSQKSLFNAANEAFYLLPTNRPIYLLGESLGSGVATYLAGTYSNKIAGVVLISPFNSLTDVAQSHFPLLPVRWLLADRFPSESYLRNYRGKLGVTIDGQDTVVPKKFGLRLFDGYAGPKKLWEFPDGGHCQITEEPPKFWREVVEFWQRDSAR